MDFLGTVTWTQMTILGAFIIFYLSLTRELRYGIPYKQIIAWIFGSFGVGTFLSVDVFFVSLMTVAYYSKLYALFYSSASIVILIQFAILLGFIFMNSTSIQERIIQDKAVLTDDTDHFLASDIVAGTEPMEQKVRLLGKIFSENIKLISNLNAPYFCHILHQFEAINSRLCVMDESERLHFYSIHPPVLLNLFKNDKDSPWPFRLWMGAFIITSLQSKDAESFDPICQVFYELATSEDESKRKELVYLFAILIHAVFFLFASEKRFDRDKVANGLSDLIQSLQHIKSINENFFISASGVAESEQYFFRENLSLWMKGYGILNESMLLKDAILSSLNGLSFQGEPFPDYINGLILDCKK